MENAAERLDIIRTRIERARRRFGPPHFAGVSRDAPADEVTLVAVSKTFPAAEIAPFLDAGQRVFGENRVQEAEAKWPGLRTSYDGIELHLIGPLQSNKAREAVALFDVIETVDRDKIAGALKAEMDKQGRRPRLLVQVNIGMEPQKAGIPPAEALAFVARCREVHGLQIEGLMAIPPEGVLPGPYFAQMAMLQRDAKLPVLSMGMSGDFEAAIAMGATHVRVGSALFGHRVRPPAKSLD
jgi:pyridoxal phosphate enzyme (YggS family)